MLAGNVAALLSPIPLIAIFTLIFGLDKYDWKSMMEIRKGDDHDVADAAGVDLEEIPGGHNESQVEFEDEQKKLERAGKISKTATVIMVSFHAPAASTTPANKSSSDACAPDPLADAPLRHWLHLQQEVLHWLGHCGHHLDLLLLHWRRPLPRL
jgi:hypothetical protein